MRDSHPPGAIVEIFDPPHRSCPACGAYAVCYLPTVLLSRQTDGTSQVCHPSHGGCNLGYAEPDVLDSGRIVSEMSDTDLRVAMTQAWDMSHTADLRKLRAESARRGMGK